MRTGIICDIQADCYCVLTDRGDFVLRRGRPPRGKGVGDRIVLAASRRWLPLAAAAAVLILAAVPLLDFFRPQPEQFSLTLDVNPSVELVYARDYTLLAWHGRNRAGQELLAGLERPGDVYSALGAVFARCVERELARDQQDIFVTAPEGAPLDQERLLGALDGRGVRVRVHMVRLPQSRGRRQSSSLRAYLNAMYQAGLDDSEPVAEAALAHLHDELVSSVEVQPWHDNPLVQAIVEQFRISSRLAEEMLAEGLTPEEVAALLELAAAGQLSPGDIFQELRDSGLAPGQFLQDKGAAGGKPPKLSGPEWLPHLLAAEFGHPAGQLSSILNRGVAPEDLQALLVMEAMGGGKLQTLVRRRGSASLETLVREAGLDRGEFEAQCRRIGELVSSAAARADEAFVADLAGRYKVARGEVLYILARGWTEEEAEAILVAKGKGKRYWKEFLDEFEAGNPENPGQGNNKPGKGNPGKGNPGKRPVVPPGLNKGN
ncbi:MAG TPA: hypothetical protein PKL39_07715 [Bacillota bacterium]|nr:hypothetical protein [Bacillota bacterium]